MSTPTGTPVTPQNTPAPAKGKAKDRPPLWLHPGGQWCRKIRGHFFYFGTDKDEALKRWEREGPYLLDGRTPPPIDAEERLTVRGLVNRFLTAKRQLVDAGELSTRHWEDLYRVCEEITDAFGKEAAVEDLTPADFGRLHGRFVKRLGTYARVSEIARARSVFKYAVDEDLIERPVRFGTLFKRPSSKTLRKEREKKGPRLFPREELVALLDGARQPLKAMILLALNCGYGNTDVATLPWKALDLAGGWATFGRKKTGTPRRAKLWVETIAALEDWRPHCPKPKDHADAGLVFITPTGKRWVTDPTFDDERPNKTRPAVDEVSRVFRLARKKAGIERPGLNFYALRHQYRTIADAACDTPATDWTMGHVAPSMASLYRETIDDARLARVSAHVHDWLFPSDPAPTLKLADVPEEHDHPQKAAQ